MTQKQLGNSSVVSYNPNGTDIALVFNAAAYLDSSGLGGGGGGAYQPDWSPDGEWIVVGLGVCALFLFLSSLFSSSFFPLSS